MGRLKLRADGYSKISEKIFFDLRKHFKGDVLVTMFVQDGRLFLLNARLPTKDDLLELEDSDSDYSEGDYFG